MPRHKVLHIVIFIFALNYITDCPAAWAALAAKNIQLSFNTTACFQIKKRNFSGAEKDQTAVPHIFTHDATVFSTPAAKLLTLTASFPGTLKNIFFITTKRLLL